MTSTVRQCRLAVGARCGAGIVCATLALGADAGVALAAGHGGRTSHHAASPMAALTGVPLALLIAIAGAVVGAFVVFVCRESREAWLHRRGLLTGFWLWVTYNRGDVTMEDPIFSIELLEIKHRHSTKGEKINGTAWRVFAADGRTFTWDRRWTLTGWALDKFVECVYKSETGGGNGVVNMWRTNGGYEGEYITATTAARKGKPNDSIVTEWARLPREFPRKLQEAIESIPDEEARRYPRRVRRALGLDRPLLRRIGMQAPYLVVAVDNQFALQSAIAEQAAELDNTFDGEALTIRRNDLGLGTGAVRAVRRFGRRGGQADASWENVA